MKLDKELVLKELLSIASELNNIFLFFEYFFISFVQNFIAHEFFFNLIFLSCSSRNQDFESKNCFDNTICFVSLIKLLSLTKSTFFL